MTSDYQHKVGSKRIEVEEDGPYTVCGSVPLVRKVQVVSEYGEPLTWKKEGVIETEETYQLCRCGQSGDKPFCDMTHISIDFDGAEAADITPITERQLTIEGGTGIVVKCDQSLCMNSGFCTNRLTDIKKMVADTADTNVRSQVIAMIERCPSSALTYSIQEGEPDIEPDLPQQIAVTTEITSDGPIAGPMWVTGNIPIERADGQPFETLNRVTLCCCGLSQNKPLCDGTHRVKSTHHIGSK
jgi:CDGSH-type Zn-finger protein